MENIKVCVFDAYGTLFDVHSATKKFKDEIGENYIEFSELWRAKQLEYSFLREILGEYKKFILVTEDALEYAMKSYNIDIALKDKLMSSYMELEAYSEVIEVLKTLKEKGISTAILSNGSNDMLEAAVENSKLYNYLDKVFSVEEIEKFKPNREVYKIINNKMNVENNEVVFFSSNGWDIAGAASYGFNTIWINRFSKQIDNLDSKPSIVVKDLKEAIKFIN